MRLLGAAVVISVAVAVAISAAAADVSFDANYFVDWGNNHVTSSDQGREIQLLMDKSSGSGFASKSSYGSGCFEIRMKVPGHDTAGVVTSFYLTSNTEDRHDELDFEFLGNRERKPVTLQTNIMAEGVGNREQRIYLWFDPAADFHSYKILWNQHQIVFYVDNIPIRVFKNKENIGVRYPSFHALQIKGSLWNAESWATDGGKAKINWSQAPFKAEFQGFNVDGCTADPKSNDINRCFSRGAYWWNSKKLWSLNREERVQYLKVRRNFMHYDYCADLPRFPTLPPECKRH
ncbi:PREDICTED: xyloglucan endotransglucosylase/hydrolase protein 2-like [Ipomoea nil]|uniref:xyloglucan endotransglucosylase/hydrolase protein 2-like n=1 Tax=Ipomoea nil TaxID=35883 RepID=UPI00090122A9|nr:PREDICTED: xyloglucan endotransglucosylase/hydrolase protein 2-like [Ipomoea nil]